MASTAPAPADEPGGSGAMPDNELASLLAAHEARAVGYYNSEIADQQAKAINYYYGIMDDLPALDGCSSVVDHTVAVMVDNGLAAILKPFVSADEVVSFEPRSEEDKEQAEQATEYVNYVINCDNPGFLILHDWFKDALLTKLGIVKVWWEDTSRNEERVVGVDAMGLEMARQDENYLAEQDNGDGTFAVRLNQLIPDGRVKIVNVPPEEFKISPFARSIEEAPYVAHTPANVTRSDLLAMGFDADVVMGLPAYAAGNQEESRGQARYRDEEWFSGTREAIGSDKSRDVIALKDEFVQVDYDGDGIAELRRVLRVEDTILYNEVAAEVQFATLCPVPMPHKVYGRSVADQSIEGQKVSTAVTRQTLDNLYRHNNPRPVMGERAYRDDGSTSDALGDSSPGAALPVKDIGQIDWMVVPFAADKSFQMLEYVQQQTEERTGVQRKGNGFNAEALKKNSPDTATQAAIDENSRNERAEMIARIFAETGVKRLFKLILKLLIQHQPRERIIRLRNKFVAMDPRGWSPEMDLSISVGLGVGNKAEQIEQASVVLEMMERLQGTPFAYLVTAEHVHNAVKRFYTAVGIKNGDDFVGDPREMEPPPPQPDAEMAKVQMQGQIEQAKLQAKMQSDQATHQAEMVKMQAKHQLEQAQATSKLQLEAMKAQQDAELARAKAEFEASLAQQKMMFEQQLAEQKMAIDAQIAAQRTENDREAKMSKNRKGGDLSK